MTALKDLRGLVVIDEVQHAPELFKPLRVLADRSGAPARFLSLGSASPALLRQRSESLAGRVEVIETGGFTLDETGAAGRAAQGLLRELLGIADPAALARHPKSGASREGFALDQVLRIARPDAALFWATHGGAERDLLMFQDGRRVGVEFKRADAPTLTPSMRVALADLVLDTLYVVYPGARRYRLAERVEAVPLSALLDR